jgi:cytochrome c5
MKFNKIFAIGFILIMICSSLSFAQEMGNPRKGKYLYRKHCLSCHKYGTDHQLGPDSKTMKEWKTAFKKEKIKTYPCKEHWSKLSNDDIIDIYTHMYSHASDSPQPASCK